MASSVGQAATISIQMGDRPPVVLTIQGVTQPVTVNMGELTITVVRSAPGDHQDADGEAGDGPAPSDDHQGSDGEAVNGSAPRGDHQDSDDEALNSSVTHEDSDSSDEELFGPAPTNDHQDSDGEARNSSVTRDDGDSSDEELFVKPYPWERQREPDRTRSWSYAPSRTRTFRDIRKEQADNNEELYCKAPTYTAAIPSSKNAVTQDGVATHAKAGPSGKTPTTGIEAPARTEEPTPTEKPSITGEPAVTQDGVATDAKAGPSGKTPTTGIEAPARTEEPTPAEKPSITGEPAVTNEAITNKANNNKHPTTSDRAATDEPPTKKHKGITGPQDGRADGGEKETMKKYGHRLYSAQSTFKQAPKTYSDFADFCEGKLQNEDPRVKEERERERRDRATRPVESNRAEGHF
ncbi:hypothetical protein F5Y18DRAFT_436809 [Xylariaceae sp. FL1019]|nr:hypothetical protein F5Y18DRAFT_436809 [Xylariaceae sp. FL1019]